MVSFFQKTVFLAILAVCLILPAFSLSLLAQGNSNDPPVLPPKLASEATVEQAPDAIPTKERPSEAAKALADLDNMSSFSLSLIVLSMLIGGLILLFVEVALIPGFGLVGLTGIFVILMGLGLAFWKLDFRLAILYTVLSVVALILIILWTVYVFPHTSAGKRFVLTTKINVEDGFDATQDLSRFIGKEGIATSDLRPSGIARIGEERVDVVSDGDFIPRGSRIKAVQTKHTNLVVIRLEPLPEPPDMPKA